MFVHRLIDSPEAGKYLPFAEARLRALASIYSTSGYFRQKYVVEGFQIEVAQEPPLQFIRISGGAVNVPDFVSGIVTDPRRITETVGDVTTRYLKEFWPTALCAELFALSADPARIEKLEVLVTEDIPELAPPGDNIDLPFSPDTLVPDPETGEPTLQYEYLKPTMYSGRMRKLVQLLMGFGRQAKRSVYDKTKDYVWPQTNREQAIKENGRKIPFDYRFERCHGLIKAVDDKWWVVEISEANGVVAMPLLFYPASQTAAFARKLVDLGDVAGQEAFAEFGGWPTGEGLALDQEEFDAWERAGRTVRILEAGDMAEFYALSSYSGDCGWAFDYGGSEARNTAYDDSEPAVLGKYYSLQITIDAPPDDFKAPTGGGEVAAALESLRYVYPLTFEANIYKLGRLSQSDMDELIRSITRSDVTDLYLSLDSLEGIPLSAGAALLTKEEEGYLFTIATTPHSKIAFADMYHVQDATYVGPQLVDLEPSTTRGDFPDEAICDTAVYVFFDQDDALHEVKWFYDDTTVVAGGVVDGIGAAPAIGVRTTTGAQSYHNPLPYTSDFDDRALDPPDLTVETVTVAAENASYWALLNTVDERYDARSFSSVIIPFCEREGYYYVYGSIDYFHTTFEMYSAEQKQPPVAGPIPDTPDPVTTSYAFTTLDYTARLYTSAGEPGFTVATGDLARSTDDSRSDPDMYDQWFLPDSTQFYLGETHNVLGSSTSMVHDTIIAEYNGDPIAAQTGRTIRSTPTTPEMVNADDLFSLSATYVGVVDDPD